MAPLPGTAKAPSLVDVARVSGVSTQTVSRVVHGMANVLPATRDRVESAMRELGYRPNLAARALRTGRFGDIGVVLFSLSAYGNMRTLEAITHAAASADHAVTMMTVEHPDGRDLTRSLGRLYDQAVDGALLVLESAVDSPSDLRLPTELPLTVIASVPDLDPAYVDTDQEGGARQVVQHLLDLGHDTVHHLRGPLTSFAAAGRERAWAATLRDAGRTVPEPLLGDWTTASGYAHGRRLALRDDVTAVFAANDHMALGLLRACHEVGRPVPASMSIAGFDDTPESQSFWPPLTTVEQDFTALGERAVAQLLDRVSGIVPTEAVLVPTRLVVRQSTAGRP